MELKIVLSILEKRLTIIIISLFLTLATGAIFTFIVMDKVYEASTTLIVSKQIDSGTYNQLEYDDILINTELAKTYSIIIKSNRILNQVTNSLNLPGDFEKLRKSISVNPETESQIIRITVQNKDPRQAVSIADSVAAIFQKQVVILLKMDNVQILDVAQLPVKPTSPQPLLNLFLSLAIGTCLGIGTAFLIEYFDNTVKKAEDIEQFLGLMVLGIIPMLAEEQSNVKEVVNE